MKTISRAPLRLGLAGGGTDVSPYTELFGGHVVNAAISLYAQVTLEDIDEPVVEIISAGDKPHYYMASEKIRYSNTGIDLAAAVFNHFLPHIRGRGMRISFSLDAPLGSGLGTSSTLVVALSGAFARHLGHPLSKLEIASLAFELERNELGLAGGRQDQYAAVFGGFNHLHFNVDGKVDVEALTLSDSFLEILHRHLLLYYTAHNRHSARIIEEQSGHAMRRDPEPLEAMHRIGHQAVQMRKALMDEDLQAVSDLLREGFINKKRMASGISTDHLERIHAAAIEAGAWSGKISGAGGGGFMFFLRPPSRAIPVSEALHTFGGREYPFRFDREGLSIFQEAYG